MAIIQWNDKLSVKVKEIDDQHKKLIQLVCDLETAMGSGKGKDVLNKIIVELMNYTVYHFALEEKYMTQYRYADIQTHKAEHAKFIAEVTAFKKDFDSGVLGLSLKVLQFLSDWLKTHIMGTDQKYSDCFTRNGLA